MTALYILAALVITLLFRLVYLFGTYLDSNETEQKAKTVRDSINEFNRNRG